MKVLLRSVNRCFFFFSSRRRHTRYWRDWSSDVCSSDLLYADGKLQPGQVWRQESIVGSVFEGSISIVDGKIYPLIRGTAYINAEAELILDGRDPFCMGIRR